jgi:hypothetical protein
VSDERFCTNCRVEVPKGASACPACGVYAGDVFDGRMPREKRSHAPWLVIVGVIALVAGAALFVRWPRAPHTPARAPTAKSLPGPAGAMLAIRQRLVSDQLTNECLALIGKGSRDGAYLVAAVDRCQHRSLGEWKVDRRTHAVSRVR